MSVEKKWHRWIAVAVALLMLVTLAVPMNVAKASAATTNLQNPRTASDGTVTWDCVWFGHYPQSSDGKGGFNSDPIKWRVLSVNGSEALLLADKNLDGGIVYSNINMSTTWLICTMRSWLNGYGKSENQCLTDYTSDNFINRAFTSGEQEAIMKKTVINADNPEYGTEGGNNTTDKVFLASIGEMTTPAYGFPADSGNSKSREAVNTAYTASRLGAAGEGVKNDYWLRSPGSYSYYAACVCPNGSVKKDGVVAYGAMYCVVRPALRLNLTSNLWSYAGTVSSDGTADEEGVDAGSGFDLKKDGHCVVNSAQGFNYNSWKNWFGLFGYKIPLERYQEVYGKSYTKHIYKQNITTWGGSCFGMSSTAALIYKDKLELSDYTSKSGVLASIGYDDMITKSGGQVYLRLNNDSKLTKLIERYQIWNSSDDLYSLRLENLKKYKTYEEMFSDALAKVEDKKQPLLAIIFWERNSSKVGHALVVDSSRKPKDLGDGWKRVYLYDPNNPSFESFKSKTPISPYLYAEDRYIDINEDTGYWEMSPTVNSNGESEEKIGYNEDGSILDSSIEFINTDQFPSNFKKKANFSSSGADTEISYASDAFKIYNADHTLIYERDNGKVISSNKDLVTDLTECGYAEDAELGLSQGRLILPKGQYTVKIDSGAIAYLEDGDYAGVVTKDEATIGNQNSTSLSISAPSSTEVNLVLEDKNDDDYTSIETDLLVDKNGCELSLNDDILQVDTDKEQEIDVGVITEKAESEIENVNVCEKKLIELEQPAEEEINPVVPSKPITPTVKASQTITANSFTKTYGNKPFSLGAKAKTKLTYKSSDTKVATVSNNGKVTLKGPGKATITITAAATSQYNAATKKITITVKPKQTAGIKVKKGKKRMTVSWKRDKKATGYQITYAQNKKFKKGKKNITISKNKTVKRTIKKLKARKTYYVKVRAYKKVGKTKIYGDYSKVKKVKVR